MTKEEAIKIVEEAVRKNGQLAIAINVLRKDWYNGGINKAIEHLPYLQGYITAQVTYQIDALKTLFEWEKKRKP